MRRAIPFFVIAGILALALLFAQSAPTGPMNLTATTVNVAGAPDTVRIEILRWSTDEEREKLMSAWELKPSASGSSAPGRGAGKQGRGGAKGAAPGGGRGRGEASASEAEVMTPASALAKALEETTTVGYLWSSENVGYAFRYAGRIANPDGSQRVILITDRRLGAANRLWDPTVKGDPNPYEFSVIELHLNAKEEGEGKASLIGKVAPDAAAKIVTLENYDALPPVFKSVRSQTAGTATKR
jgi:hypothetical protein